MGDSKPAAGDGARNPGRTLLIVDDDATNLAVLSSTLRPHYRVRAAKDGASALRAAASEPAPDLLLLDVMMPEMDGFDVLARLRADPKTAPIPVIFVTALGDDADEERGLALGAVDFITKPIRPAVVLARVRTHLALKEARDRLAQQNAWLESEVERRTRDTQTIQEVTLSIITGLVETRDLDTGNHTLRTQAYVESLGRRLQREPRYAAALAPHLLTRMVKASPLHDIGKIGIPDAILLKPGPLTPPELEIMKTHARLGGDAITRAIERVTGGDLLGTYGEDVPTSLAFLETARQMARWHHERWAGGGYPDGLSGEHIPVCARIMGVADMFDAITTKRVYKPAMSAAEAVAIVTKIRGTQLDPEVVDAFVSITDDFAAIARRYADAPDA
ncbi:MAG: response regulator [Polyangiaceae bacterium]